ncbi:MAG: DUF3450 family protein [Candidatus Eisenbacteria bacterium]|nr:DUF3450 family protein [Candidatus Eisenbacteria bacterium]
MRRFWWVGLVLVLAAGQLLAQSTADELRETVDETVDIEQETQEKRDAWAEEQAALEARYRTAKANIRYLNERITSEEKQAQALEESIAELERRLSEARLLQSGLQDTLDVVYARLQRFVERDIPFLVDERARRLERLDRELNRPEVTGAEKLRRLLEAMMIETEYGNAVEVNQDEIEVEGETIFADVLRVGRVSLFWRTPDGERVGTFDEADWKWVELPQKYGRNIGMAIEMASRLRPVQLITLPLGRVQS